MEKPPTPPAASRWLRLTTIVGSIAGAIIVVYATLLLSGWSEHALITKLMLLACVVSSVAAASCASRLNAERLDEKIAQRLEASARAAVRRHEQITNTLHHAGLTLADIQQNTGEIPRQATFTVCQAERMLSGYDRGWADAAAGRPLADPDGPSVLRFPQVNR